MTEQLLPTIRDLMGDSGRLAEMREQAGKLTQPNGAQNLAELTAQLARGEL
jgi:UDP-N-acetylglucosamine:LPS N-acetylglucosamine transferase